MFTITTVHLTNLNFYANCTDRRTVRYPYGTYQYSTRDLSVHKSILAIDIEKMYMGPNKIEQYLYLRKYTVENF